MTTFMNALSAWINRRLDPARPVGPDTPLFDGLIDSIRILELIAWTERETGRRIPDTMIRMDHFRTVRRIAETFATEASHVDG